MSALILININIVITLAGILRRVALAFMPAPYLYLCDDTTVNLVSYDRTHPPQEYPPRCPKLCRYGWYFLTLCTFRRSPYFRIDSTARWLLRVLQEEAAEACFQLHAYCLMPDHLHVLLQGTKAGADLLGFVKVFKHKTSFHFARRAGKRLWQTSFYDHILRGEEAPADVGW